MQTGRTRALIACIDATGARRYAGLLSEAGFTPVAAVHSAREVLPALREHRPHVLLAESILPGGDGASLARTVAEASLDRYPCMLLINIAGFRLPGAESLDDCGAALLGGPTTAASIRDTVVALDNRAAQLPRARREKLEALLDRLGVPAHPGREMLACAVALAWRDRERLQNLRDRIYPDAARPFDRTGAQAERAIRHVIDVAWRTGEIDEQQRVFGDTIDARRGRPTCGEMIAQLADILRWEG